MDTPATESQTPGKYPRKVRWIAEINCDRAWETSGAACGDRTMSDSGTDFSWCHSDRWLRSFEIFRSPSTACWCKTRMTMSCRTLFELTATRHPRDKLWDGGDPTLFQWIQLESSRRWLQSTTALESAWRRSFRTKTSRRGGRRWWDDPIWTRLWYSHSLTFCGDSRENCALNDNFVYLRIIVVLIRTSQTTGETKTEMTFRRSLFSTGVNISSGSKLATSTSYFVFGYMWWLMACETRHSR